jgi:hypothetical protein
MSQYMPKTAIIRPAACVAIGTATQPGRPETRSPNAPRLRSRLIRPSRWPTMTQVAMPAATMPARVPKTIWRIAPPPAETFSFGLPWASASGARARAVRAASPAAVM